MQLYVGAQLERPPGPKYAGALPFAELIFPGSLPKPKTLARWRQSVPEGFRTAIVVPAGARGPNRAPLRLTDDAKEALDWLSDAAEVLQADVVLPTGSGLSTSKRDQERLAEFVERLPEVEGRHRIWAPQGLWERDLAYPVAESLGLVCAYDPLADEPPESAVAYARVATIGARRRLSEGLLFELLEALIEAEPEEAFVAIESARSFDEAVALQRLATEG